MPAGLGPWLLALASALALGPAGLWAQLELEEAGGGLRAPGESVHFSCRGSGFTFQNHYVRWYRQAPRGEFEWVFLSGESGLVPCRGSGGIFGGYTIQWYRRAPRSSLEWVSFISSLGSVTKYEAAVEGQVTVSRDSFQSQSSLYLRDLHPRDSAWYFCAFARRQETQLGFNANLLGSGTGCIRCGEGESCQGPGGDGCSHEGFSGLYCTLQGFCLIAS